MFRITGNGRSRVLSLPAAGRLAKKLPTGFLAELASVEDKWVEDGELWTMVVLSRRIAASSGVTETRGETTESTHCSADTEIVERELHGSHEVTSTPRQKEKRRKLAVSEGEGTHLGSTESERDPDDATL